MNRVPRILGATGKVLAIVFATFLVLVLVTGTQEAITRLSDEVQIEAHCARHMERLAKQLNVAAGPGACRMEYLDDLLGMAEYTIHFRELNAEKGNDVGLSVGWAFLRFTPVDGRDFLKSGYATPARAD